MEDTFTEHACGAYAPTDECSSCGGIADRSYPGTMQGIHYVCRVCGRDTLVIDWCECEDDEDDDAETCRTCHASYSGFGDGWNGECGNCADRSYNEDE